MPTTCLVCGATEEAGPDRTCPVCGADLPAADDVDATSDVDPRPDAPYDLDPRPDATSDVGPRPDGPSDASSDATRPLPDGPVPPPPPAPPAAGPAVPPPPGEPPPAASWPPGGSTPPPSTAAPHHSGVPASMRTYGMLTHLSAFAGAIVALAFVGPLVMWLVRRDEHPFLDHHGTEALNFNLSMLLYGVIGVVGTVATLGLGAIVVIPAVVVFFVTWVVCTIVGAVKANNGEGYRYPLSIRFVKER